MSSDRVAEDELMGPVLKEPGLGSRAFLHVVNKDVAEVMTFEELRSLPCYSLEEFAVFLHTAVAGDTFQFQHEEYFVALGITIRASWLG